MRKRIDNYSNEYSKLHRASQCTGWVKGETDALCESGECLCIGRLCKFLFFIFTSNLP